MTFIKLDLNQEQPQADNSIVKIDTWYDRHTRLWCIQLLNKDGYQVGDARWAYGKKAAKVVTDELKKEFGINE